MGDRENAYWYTIVGVVGNVRDDSLSADVPEMLYFPPVRYDRDREASAETTMSIAVRTAGPPLALAGVVREVIWSLDPQLPIADMRTAESIVSSSTRRTTFAMVLLGLAAGMALLLGAVGIYGVISYLVSLRKQEIGVRMALGARSSTVGRMVVVQGLRMSGAGVVLGLLAAWGLTRLMASLLYGVSPTDPVIFATVSILVLAISALAGLLPALRAARVSPAQALRSS
jgi:ABC-type antimicrobial peptide transport system permease subunit